MDCGPAALAVLLGAHGLACGVDALRGLCATDVDGTSIDDLEAIASRLGLDAEQVVVPLGQVLATPERHFPAILLTRTPHGFLHFVVAWRVRRGRVDLVDPAVGRRRVRIADLQGEALRHTVLATADEWAEYALGEDTLAALRVRAPARLPRRPTPAAIAALLADLEGAPVAEPLDEGTLAFHGAVLLRAPRLQPPPSADAALWARV